MTAPAQQSHFLRVRARLFLIWLGASCSVPETGVDQGSDVDTGTPRTERRAKIRPKRLLVQNKKTVDVLRATSTMTK